MKRCTGKLTRQDILDAGGVTFCTNSSLETRMVLDVLRFEMGFALANEAVEKTMLGGFNQVIVADKHGKLWCGYHESGVHVHHPVATIENLIPDYVDPLTARFNILAARLGTLEERMTALEQKSGRVIRTGAIIAPGGPAA